MKILRSLGRNHGIQVTSTAVPFPLHETFAASLQLRHKWASLAPRSASSPWSHECARWSRRTASVPGRLAAPSSLSREASAPRSHHEASLGSSRGRARRAGAGIVPCPK